jgi:hypothetical protein
MMPIRKRKHGLSGFFVMKKQQQIHKALRSQKSSKQKPSRTLRKS